jgi:hypothetical protein
LPPSEFERPVIERDYMYNETYSPILSVIERNFV